MAPLPHFQPPKPSLTGESSHCINASLSLCFDAMRTTISLDDDVAALLRRLRERSGKSLRELVNAALREGLPRLFQGREEHHRFVVRSLEVGRCLLPAVDDVAETLAAAEGEDFR